MTNDVAPFCWYELMTTDLAAAEAFYAKVIGWTAKDSGLGSHPYTVLSIGETAVAGAMALPQPLRDAGVPPHWIAYVRVEDVDAILPRLVAAGGTVHRAPEDIPGIGRFAVVADLHGAAFCLFRESAPAPAGGAAADPYPPGRVGWHELHADDGEGAFAFYSGLFGWTETDRMDMKELGYYRLFATGGPAVGGMMTRMPMVPRAVWLFYFSVDVLDAAIERLTVAGGRTTLDPMEVPGGAWIVHALDPQGGAFALVAPKR